MPFFINNKGEFIVPNLQSMAVVSDGVSEALLRNTCAVLRRIIARTRRKLGYTFPRSSNREPIYLEKDMTITYEPPPPISFCSTTEEDQYFMCGRLIDNPNMCTRFHLKHWPIISSRIRALSHEIAVVFVREIGRNREYAACSLVNTQTDHCSDSKPYALELTAKALRWLKDDDANFIHIRRLVVMDDINLPELCLEMMPHLQQLDINNCTDLEPLLKLKYSLQVLRLRVSVDSTSGQDFEQILSQLSHLKQLVIEFRCTISPTYRIKWNELNFSANMRTLTIIGIDPGVGADVIGFLTTEVDTGIRILPRQLLLDDFTIIAHIDNRRHMAVMNEVYQSEALDEYIKKRIFSNLTVGHVASALKLILSRSDYSYCMVTELMDEYALRHVRISSEDQPPLNLVWAIFDFARHSIRFGHYQHFVLTFMADLLRTRDVVETRDHRITDYIEETLNRLGRNLELPLPFNPILHKNSRIAAESDVLSGGICAILISLVNLMGYSFEHLEKVFLRRCMNLKPARLRMVLKEIEKSVCRAILLQLSESCPTTGRNILSDTRPWTPDDSRKNLLTFFRANVSTGTDLWIASNAALRRSSQPLPATWMEEEVGKKELNLFEHTFKDKIPVSLG